MEIWKHIKGYEDIYQISNLGRVKRISNFKYCNTKYLNDYYLSFKDNGKGYYRVALSLNGKRKLIMLHRLIADSFIPNPKNLKVVNHIDSNKKNNDISNLEWCTQSDNCNHFNKENPLKGSKTRKTKGYVYCKRDNTFYSRIGIDGKTINLGAFKTKEQAIEKYNQAYENKIKMLLDRQKIKELS